MAAMLLALGTVALAPGAQDAASPGATATGTPPGAASAPADATPTGVELSAKVIDLGGKVQWRPTADAAWQPANLNDVIPSGSEVRTGLRSHAALRIGPNATALIDAGTVFQLPSAVRDGDVLRTTVAVKSGRADFKVDKVGLTNDFKVVTPSTTLAVRGTSFAIATGALKQVEVVGARTNTMRAIELKYALSNTTVALSGSATSSSTVQQPAHSAVVATAAPVVAAAAPPATSAAETVVQASSGPSPAAAGSPAPVFAARCAVCHGPEGRGDGPAGAAFNPRPRDLGDPAWQASVTDAHLARVITEGGAAVGKSASMPPHPDLSPALVEGLVKLVREKVR